MEQRRLSSRWTFACKYLFPPLWIGGFGPAPLAMWAGAIHGRDGLPTPLSTKLLFSAIWVVGTAGLVWLSSRVKRVAMTEDALIVSNYLREVSIPLSQVTAVTENMYVSAHPVTIHLRADAGFGTSVTFMPYSRGSRLMTPHPVVAKIKAAAGLPA